MALQLLLAGADKTGLLVPGTLATPDRINERSEAEFDLRILAGGYYPATLDSAVIKDGATTIFEGFVWDPDEERMIEDVTRNELTSRIRCVDLHLLSDRRYPGEVYENMTAGAIVADLLSKYLAADGVTAGTIQDGPTVTKVVYPRNLSLSQVFDELAQLAGFFWQIKPGKLLDFADRTLNTAPWTVNASAKVRQVHIRRHRENYRNTQIYRGGMALTDPRSEFFVGDTKRRTWTLSFQVAQVPVYIKVNGVAKTVGILGVDAAGTKDFYWNKGTQTITQDDTGTLLTSSDTLEVRYVGMFPILAVVQNPVEVQARKTAEGTSGIYEAYAENRNIDGEDAVLQLAQAELDRNISEVYEVTFNTETAGLRAGQLLTYNLPGINLTGQHLITEVDTRELEDGKTLRYFAKTLSGTAYGSWAQFFKKLVSAGRSFVIRDNEVLIRQFSLSDGAVVGDTLSFTRAAPERRIGYATIGFSEVG